MDDLLQLKLGLFVTEAKSEFCVWQSVRLEAIIKGLEPSIDNNRGCDGCSGITYIPPFKVGCDAHVNLAYERALREVKKYGIKN